MAAALREPKVVVFGGGSWGTTVASVCARRGPTLQWVRSEKTAKDINENHRNPTIWARTSNCPKACAPPPTSPRPPAPPTSWMGVPSHGFRGAHRARERIAAVGAVVSLVKGLEQGTNMRMSQIVDEVLPGHPAGILADPTSPARLPRATQPRRYGDADQHHAAHSHSCSAPGVSACTPSTTWSGEMAGALKNVYAIAVGMGYSLGIGENTRAMVIARSVREMSKLGEAMGGHRDTFFGLAGMGDLIVTCTSQRSRNRHVGEQLGSVKPIDEIISSMKAPGRQGRRRDHGMRRQIRVEHATRPRVRSDQPRLEWGRPTAADGGDSRARGPRRGFLSRKAPPATSARRRRSLSASSVPIATATTIRRNGQSIRRAQMTIRRDRCNGSPAGDITYVT